MPELADEFQCTGCSACAAICPNEAIEMEYNHEGFIFPKIITTKCCDCRMCEKICPILNSRKISQKEYNIYLAGIKDKKIRKKSTSGGVFTGIAQFVFSHNGLVVGAQFDQRMVLKHVIAESEKEINMMRGSKYIQSEVKDVYALVKKELDNNRMILFTGTPCQIDGLLHFLEKAYDNLITCDVLCHGVASSRFFYDAIKWYEKEQGSKVTNIYFRDKRKSWEKSEFRVEFINGKALHFPSYLNEFGYPFSHRLCCRKSCFKCKYSSTERISDISIGDYTGTDKNKYSYFDRHSGLSLVIVSSLKGKEVISALSNTVDIEAKSREICKTNPALRNRDDSLRERNLFFSTYNEKGFDFVRKSYATPTKEEILRFKYGKLLNVIHNILVKLNIR